MDIVRLTANIGLRNSSEVFGSNDLGRETTQTVCYGSFNSIYEYLICNRTAFYARGHSISPLTKLASKKVSMDQNMRNHIYHLKSVMISFPSVLKISFSFQFYVSPTVGVL